MWIKSPSSSSFFFSFLVNAVDDPFLKCQGAPANVKLFEVANVSQAEPVARRSFFKSNTAQLMWNKGSTGVLVLATSDVDKTNQNYYGESRLHFLTSDGRHEGAVPLSESSTPKVDWLKSTSYWSMCKVFQYLILKISTFWRIFLKFCPITSLTKFYNIWPYLSWVKSSFFCRKNILVLSQNGSFQLEG